MPLKWPPGSPFIPGARRRVECDARCSAGADRAAVPPVREPHRFGLPAFYTLHVWAWKESPTATFVNWHTNVSCDAFRGQNR